MLNISVIIPVYNAEQFLEKAVDSALQFEEVKEILLVEDNSPDNSLDICKRLIQKDSRIKLSRHADGGNHGAGATRNLGLEKASQEFIAFLDADDYYLPNRFDAEKNLLQDEKIEGVFGAIGMDFLTAQGEKEFREKFKENNLTTVKYAAEGKEVFLGITGVKKDFGLFFHLNTLTLRNSTVKKVGLKFNPELKVHQDTDFITKAAFYLHLKTGIINQAIALRGVHDDNRITKIKQYSSAFYSNIFRLYSSLYEWSRLQKDMDIEAKKLIKYRFLSFKTANLKGFKKYFSFAKWAITNPKILRTSYRFHALNKPQE